MHKKDQGRIFEETVRWDCDLRELQNTLQEAIDLRDDYTGPGTAEAYIALECCGCSWFNVVVKTLED